MKHRYIELMAKTLSAYTDEHIVRYFDEVKQKGLTEHGFPRLTANLGILIAHGYRRDLLPLFLDMMDFCCEQIPTRRAANDFSVKEIIFCIMEHEGKGIVEADRIEAWKTRLAAIDPYTCYNVIARHPTLAYANWACFTAVSEWMRQHIGLADTTATVETQIATQLLRFDENGMYRDPHEPMVYDLVTRGLMVMLLTFGYRGKHYDEIEDNLEKAGWMTLRMQSVTGEVPYGGRSAQFVHNEPHLCIIFEHEAKRYAAKGDMALAAAFKAGANRALDNVAHWLDRTPIRHVKNAFPLETQYGCEEYAYFDKYMITCASFLYAAYLVCDDSIVPTVQDDRSSLAFTTSHYFHKIFLRHGDYFLEFDTAADPNYDTAGLGRVHRRGAPALICMSTPCISAVGSLHGICLNGHEPHPLALAVGMKVGDDWRFATGETAVEYVGMRTMQTDECASVRFACRFGDNANEEVRPQCVAHYTVTDGGVDITVEAIGAVGHLLPAFLFDGETHTAVTLSDDAKTLEIALGNWICRYTTSGTIIDTGGMAYSRNGYFRKYRAEGDGLLHLHVEIVRA